MALADRGCSGRSAFARKTNFDKPLRCSMEHEALTEKIIGCAMKVHRTLGAGFLESVYHNALLHELRKAGLKAESKCPLVVIYDGVTVGMFEPDVFVEDIVIVENKAALTLAPANEAQLVNYLTATGKDIGLLFNFGASSLQFKRKYRVYKPKGMN